MGVIDLHYRPTAKQAAFHCCTCDEVLFGGAAGGGKSHAIVMDAVDQCLRHPGIAVYLFRRTYRELGDTLIRLARNLVPETLGVFRGADHELLFVNGSVMKFRHLQTDEDKFKYQGAEINRLYIDELTHFTKSQYDFLKSRLRANVALGIKPAVRATSNPGGRGHAWVKGYFIDVAPYGTPFEEVVRSQVLDREKRVTRMYIPSRVTDNPYIGEEYVYELEQKPKALRDALLLGKWDAFEGQVFAEWTDDPNHYADRNYTHVIAPFTIPEHYPRYRSFDFGYSRPFAVLWWAVGEEGEAYLYREWYGASGPNVGIKISAADMARGILEREEGETISGGYADPSIWDSSRGESVARQMEREGVYFVPGDNARISGKMAVHQRLQFDERGRCGLQVFSTCREFIRTVPALCYDSRHPEDIDTDGEDHIYDAARYFLMNHLSGRRLAVYRPRPFDPLAEEPEGKPDFWLR